MKHVIIGHNQKSNRQVYVFKGSWGSTSKLIKVIAPNEEAASKLAERNRMVRGCQQLNLKEVRDK